MRIAIEEIVADAGTQVRLRLDPDVIDEYAQGIKDGAKFPPITVFAENGSERYYLADGFHRLAAAKKVGRTEIGADVQAGGLEQAIHKALGANAEHGMRRTTADKRHAVEMAMNNPLYDDWTVREIGELCRVSKSFVHNIREEKHDENLSTVDKTGSGASKTANVRPANDKPTQESIDKMELIGAIATLKSFPYSGKELVEKLGLDPDQIEDLKFVHTWIGEALIDTNV